MPHSMVVLLMQRVIEELPRKDLVKRRADITPSEREAYFARSNKYLPRREPTKYDNLLFKLKQQYLTENLRNEVTAWEFWQSQLKKYVNEETDMKHFIPAYLEAIYNQSEFENVIEPTKILFCFSSCDKLLHDLEKQRLKDRYMSEDGRRMLIAYRDCVAAFVYWTDQMCLKLIARNCI